MTVGQGQGKRAAVRVRDAERGGAAGAVGEPELRQLLAGLTAVRDGDFGTRLPSDSDGLLGEIATVFNGMVDQLSLFTFEVTRVAREVGTDGRLGGQAHVPGVDGTWKDLTDSVNAMAGNLTTQVRDIAQVATAVARGDLSQKITVDARGEIHALKKTINTMVDELSAFADEVTRVAREVGTDGRLGGQAQVPGVGGTWRDLTDSVNFMAGNLTAQVRSIAQVATAVAQGDLTRKIDVDARGEILELKTTINTMVDQLSAFAAEVTRVAREVGTEGRLGGQADVKGVSGTWKDLTESVNVMGDNLTAQVRSIAQVTTAVAQGDLSQKIRVDARGEILELKETINTMVDQLSAFADEVTRVAREVGTEGNLGGQATVRGVSGTWKDLTDNVNVMASNLTSQVRSIAQVATAVARGDLSQKITVEAKGEVAALAGVINTMVTTLSAFADEVTRVAREVGTEGILGGQAQVPNVAGTWKDLTENVNSMANNLTDQVRNIAQVTTAVAQGDLTRKIDVDARGEILELKTTINTMVDQLSSFAAEVTRVAREVGSEGRLGGQAEVEGVSGTWKRLTENVNELAGNLTRQVRAIAEVTGAVAEGDLTRSITVDASGEVSELKDNINSMVESLRETTRANQEQDWLKTNLARMSGLMQGRRDLKVVAELIMDELTPLVGAQYGGFYLAQEHAGISELELIGSYGHPGDASDVDRPVRFRFGQSLVGQAARSRRTIAIDELPAGYITISSGLGSTDPSSLIVLPIVVEGQVLGVIELASVTAFTQVHRDFLDQLMETVGVNVNTIVANARTDELLGESQRLAAELQARSGELQVRQEELQNSNAELEEKAALLASQNRDIETKNLEIEQARQELEERARQLSLASKYKSEFLANMSHELRTPLNSLLILAQLLSQNPTRNLTPKQVEYAGIIHSAGSDLLQLINDILDLSKVEAGKMDISPERVPLRRLLDYVEATFRPMTAQKGLDFRISVAPGVPTDLVTDDSRLRQVLRNLLSNAVKFTEEGAVELRIAPAADTDVPPHVREYGPALSFRVLDTGIGIAEPQLEAIFGAFQQADGTTSRKYGGTGLGLSISRELAHLLGGVIEASSTLGEGSAFTLHLPVARFEEREPAPGDQESQQPLELSAPHVIPAQRRLLVIEDRPRGLLSLVAESAVAELADNHTLVDARGPVRLRTAVGPEEAAAALAAEPCHCVVLGLDMAGGAAMQLLEALNGDPALRQVPVLAHHTRRLDHQQERRLRELARMKPLELLPSLDELRERIALHLTAERPSDVLPLAWSAESAALTASPHSLDAGPDSQLTGRVVLVVDDDARNVYALTGILETQGMQVLHADNGRKGLEVLARHDRIELILMDVMMPEMDGYAATAAIRAMPEHADLPIIAVTAKAMEGDREKSLAAGANDYITKPVDADVLVACMIRWLNR
ncbi:hybrid sensor histidine kinase/response regulator [Streptomyces agglomeratus]|uniref:Circadian input-output histidine kinase CikA n=1 Tax=Streptomyces agglomeratus TaxID=285458 RepID=A0A1E5PGF0_9ACTN|nr:HAMP domain-containing protein [Streptomyces agglomeratus]OEJ28454.1 hybrid sensor histidine kinase/response regulator [Streptomyces agglomeratus]OEJ37486.1 hybrid sensor histidine kinase/response regulator [Streptomyces agglomeratus]OEJ48130.1 hybrid sensor histidine kinase/response regulator [Streptomyces agglomeratus]OEJ50027.1 hybrid sensor histidine kinase/response regulator [Streptomyces agglomeratus]